jgi:hypothetical protein
MYELQRCPKSIRLYYFPTVSNGERVGKLSVVVEGTFMRMCVHTKFQMPNWNGMPITAIKQKATHRFRTTIMFFIYIL